MSSKKEQHWAKDKVAYLYRFGDMGDRFFCHSLGW